MVATEVSAQDQGEVDKLGAFIRRRAEFPKESVADAYAAIYAEAVIFDAGTAGPGEGR